GVPSWGLPPRLAPLPPWFSSSSVRVAGLHRGRRRGASPVSLPLPVCPARGGGECAAGLRPAAAAVLVLLPGRAGVLSLRQGVPGRLAAGGPTAEPTAPGQRVRRAGPSAGACGPRAVLERLRHGADGSERDGAARQRHVVRAVPGGRFCLS